MKKTMWLMRVLKKLSAVQKKLKTKTLAKNRMPKLLACVYVEIVAIPLVVSIIVFFVFSFVKNILDEIISDYSSKIGIWSVPFKQDK